MPKQPVPPPLVEPDEPRCVCISINESWAVLLLGAVNSMQYPEYWAGTLEENRLARRQAKNLMAVISEAITMGCCCDERTQIPRRERYTSTGRMEVSYDGGQTWENGDNFDPRFNSPLFPPLKPTTPGDDVKCRAANNIAIFLQSSVNTLIAQDSVLLTIASAILVVLGGIVAIVTAGIGWGLVISLAGTFLSAGPSAIQLAFTSEVWSQLVCILYNHAADDGSFDAIAWGSVKSDIDSTFTATAQGILSHFVDLLGPVGLTNAGRQESASPLVTCEDCNTPGWCALWSVSSALQYVSSPFTGFDSVGIPQNYFVWNGTTFYEWKVALGQPGRVITRVIVEFENAVAGTDINGGLWDWVVTPGGLPANMPLTTAGNRVTINAGTSYSYLSLSLTSTSAAGHIVSIKTEGEGENPYGADNC